MKNGFIVSARYDTLFFTGSLLVPLGLWAAFSIGWMTGVAVYATFQLAFNLPHNFQTWTLSLLDEGDRAKNGRRYVIALAACILIFAVPMVLSPDGVYPWVRDALIYWGYYHLVRQHYGFQRLYERKLQNVTPLESKLYGRYLDAVSYLPLLIRFRDPELMTIHAGGMSVWVKHPVLPPSVWMPIAALYGACIAAAIAHHVWMASRGRTGLLPRALHLGTVTIGFGLAVLVIRDLVVAIAVVTAFHNLQYIGLVWFHNRTRAELGETAGNPSVGWVRNGQLAYYAGASILYGLLIFAPRALFRHERLAELPITVVVALHYYVDARVWRFSDRPQLGRYLKLTRPAPPPKAVASTG